MDECCETGNTAGGADKGRRPFDALSMFRWAVRATSDVLFPPECLSCRAQVADPGLLCPVCWHQIEFIADPICAQCGRPLELDLGPETICGACIAAPPKFERARSVMTYTPASKELVLAFKYKDRLDGASSFGAWVLRAAGPLIEDADLIVPVPMHHWRRLSRKYNQAAVLAQAIARLSGKPVAPMALRQTRATHGQQGLTAAGRRRSVAGAFQAREGQVALLKGKRVLLIDDVLTTGATVEACAAVLLRAGAAAVDVATLARVVREQSL